MPLTERVVWFAVVDYLLVSYHFAAQHFLMALPTQPPCRFDVVAIDGDRLEWLRGAFDAV